jgi:hypothetical protein
MEAVSDVDEAFAEWISDLNDLYVSASEGEIWEKLKDYRATVAHELAERVRAASPKHYMCDSGFGDVACTYEEVADLIDPKVTA